ncbi:MAG: hypothetical protein WCT77_02915 [Bacteroidota bacterium]
MEKIKFLKKTYNIIDRNSGAECVFFKVSNTEGIKIYYHEERAINARKRQIKAYKYKIGPKVLSIVHPIKFNDMIKYGYKTQVAKVVTDDGFEYTPMGKKLVKKVKKIFGRKHYIPGETVRVHNTGYIRNRPVIIDFGGCSFE